jgi:hypothetical protein
MPIESRHVLDGGRFFVSYPREDQYLVGDVVALMRLSSEVFFDRDSIKPGEKWRDVLKAAIVAAETLVLMWCDHARNSTMIEFEWTTALRAGKAVAPILLDATPMPAELQEFQWLDLQMLRRAHVALQAEIYQGIWEMITPPSDEVRAAYASDVAIAANRVTDFLLPPTAGPST